MSALDKPPDCGRILWTVPYVISVAIKQSTRHGAYSDNKHANRTLKPMPCGPSHGKIEIGKEIVHTKQRALLNFISAFTTLMPRVKFSKESISRPTELII